MRTLKEGAHLVGLAVLMLMSQLGTSLITFSNIENQSQKLLNSMRPTSKPSMRDKIRITIDNDFKESNTTKPFPGYEIADLQSSLTNFSLGSVQHWPEVRNKSSSSVNEDFQENLKLLKRLMKAKNENQQSPKLQLNTEKKIPATGDRMTNKTVALEDDINTVNALVTMLLLASKHLVEERDKLISAESTNRPPISLDIGIHRNSPKAVPIDGLDGPPIESLDRIETRTTNTSMLARSKTKKGKRNQSKKRYKPNQKNRNSVSSISKNTDRRSLADENALEQPWDHNLVRPGFDFDPEPADVSRVVSQPSEESLSSQPKEKSNGKKRKAKTKIESRLEYGNSTLEYAGNHPSVQRQLFGSGNDILAGHKPIVAHDLLHVPLRGVSNHGPSSMPAVYPFDGRQTPQQFRPIPENIFVSIPADKQRPSLNSELFEIGPNEPNKRGLEGPMLSIPPYNERITLIKDDQRNAKNTIEQQQHPLMNRGHHENEAEFYGNLLRQRLLQVPDGLNRIGQLPGHYKDANKEGEQNERASYPPMGAVSPLHQMLVAARNQQAAISAYEKRRLDYELELRKRAEAMNKKLEKQAEERNKLGDGAKVDQGNHSSGNNGQSERQSQGDVQEQNQDQNKADEPQQQDDGGSQPETESQNGQGGHLQNNEVDSGQNEQDKKSQDEQAMKGFQDFATDFADLFPPGILSKEEIKEIRQQQEEQQREQQERDEAEQGANQEQPETGNEQQNENPDQGDDGNKEQSEGPNVNNNESQPEPEVVTTTSGPIAVREAASKENRTMNGLARAGFTNKSLAPNATGTGNELANSIRNETSHKSLVHIPRQIEKTMNSTKAAWQSGSKVSKTRRSHRPDEERQHHQGSLETADSQYHDRYVRPFMAALVDNRDSSYGDNFLTEMIGIEARSDYLDGEIVDDD